MIDHDSDHSVTASRAEPLLPTPKLSEKPKKRLQKEKTEHNTEQMKKVNFAQQIQVAEFEKNPEIVI